MARMPKFAETLARLDGRPVPTINNYALHLRAAGYLTQTSKGVGAAHVTAEDAAVMVIAAMATDSPTAAPRVVETFRGLVRLPASPAKDLPRTLGLLIQLPTFGEFLSGSIDYARPLRNELGDFGFELHVSRSVPAAMLVYRDPMGCRRRVAEWVLDVRRHGADASLPEADAGTDRRLTATITHRTIFALGDLLECEEVPA